MAKNIFRSDSGLMITMSWITDCIFLSLFWLLGSVPVITAGASLAALYDASYRAFQKGEKHSWSGFWSVYKDNWKAALLPTVLFLVISAVLVKALVWTWNAAVAAQISWMLFSGAAFLAVLVIGILSVLFPMLSRFENNCAALLKNTVFLAMAHLPRTLALGLLNAATVVLCAIFVIPVFLLPSLSALLSSFLIEPMFRPYMPNENAAE